MTISSVVRRGLAAAALATVPLGAAAAPAQAAPSPVEGTAVAAGDATGPRAHILQIWGDGPAGSFYPVAAGRTLKFDIAFDLGGRRSDYTNLRYATSHPGTSMCAPLTTIEPASHWAYGMTCPVVLKAMKPGTSQKYWVTLTGKRAGKPFSVTASTLFYAPDLRTGIYVDGKRIDGTTYTVPRSKKSVSVKYVIDNKSTATLENVYVMGGERCAMGTIAAGRSGWCSFTLTRATIAEDTSLFNHYPLSEATFRIGNAYTVAPVRDTYLVAR